MIHSSLLRLGAAAALALGGAVVSAQNAQLPSQPALGFGGAVTPAFEGWFDNPDGTHNFLIGYYSRNTQAEVDIPIGPNNKFDTPNPDQGQPTHFLTRRRFGMFIVTVPKEFSKTQKIYWTLVANGITNTVPFHMHTDYNITPAKSSEESPTGEFNSPPKLRFAMNGPLFSGPFANMSKPAIERTASVGTPMPLEIWADDDAQFSSGGNGPMNESRPILVPQISKYRGPGTITLGVSNLRFETVSGGKPLKPYSGHATTTVKFSEPGDYVLHIQINDYSGQGGGGSGCCWTTTLMMVKVSA
jgi:hypothetical protein